MKRRVLALAFVVLLCCPNMVRAAPPPDARLAANPEFVRPGEPVTFSGSVGTGTVLPAVLLFDDGQQAMITSPTFSISHAYARPGEHVAFLRTLSGAFLDDAGVVVLADSARVPLGAIYSTAVSASPVLAGSVITVFLTYRIVVPGPGFPVAFNDSPPGFQAIMDLEDSQGNLIHRGDPTPLDRFDTDVVQHVSLPYSVPVDARGAYRLRVYIQAVDRGTVAVGIPTTVDVIGNSPGDSVATGGVHAAGSVEAGRRPQIHGETINPGLTLSSQRRSSMSALSAFSDPVSQRVDPLLVLTSLLPTHLASPNALDTEPKQPPALPYVSSAQRSQYYDAFGRFMATMPDVLGGFSTMRGVSGTYRTAPGWTFQASGGNTELFSFPRFDEPQTFEQFGDAFEIGRFWSPSDGVGIFHHGRGDNPSRFFYFPQGPQIADVNAIRAQGALSPRVTVAGGAAFSGYRVNLPGTQSIADTGDIVTADYHHDLTNVTVQYHNFGQSFTPGTGRDARSDRAGITASAFLPLSSVGQIGLDWDREGTRSYPGTQTFTSARLNFELAHGTNVQAQVSRDRELTQLTDVKNDILALHVGRGDPFHYFLVNGTAVFSRDFVDPTASVTTRTGSAQYSFQHGIQAIAFGVSAVQNGGVLARNNVTESLTDGITFGGRQRKIGVQAGLVSTHTWSRYFGYVNADLTGSLTYRVARGITVGFKAERTVFVSQRAFFNTVAGGERFVLIIDR